MGDIQLRSKVYAILGLSCVVFGTTVHFATVNDCHAIMEPFGYRDSITLEANLGGYARAVTVVDSLHDLYPDIIFTHAGDVITGDFLSQLTIGGAMFDLWMAAGVKAFALGNHEFEYGPELLDSMLGEIDVPLICANLDATGFPNIASSIEPYRIFPYPGETPGDSIYIAFIGTCTEETDLAGWTAPLDLSNAITAIETLGVPPGADCAVALEHLDILEDREVAAFPFIDAVLAGHDHSIFTEPDFVISGTDSTPIVMAGPHIYNVGHLTMEFVEGEGLHYVDWEIIHITDAIPEDSVARARLDVYRDSITANLGYDPYDSVVFYADSNIAASPVCPSGSGFRDTPEGNLVTDAYRKAIGSDVTAEAVGSMRMRIYKGPVTCADLFRAMPMEYDPESRTNGRLISIDFTGDQFKQMIELVLYASGIGGEAFPQFSGMSFEFDAYGPTLNKVDTGSWIIAGAPWSGSDVYSIGASTIFLHALNVAGFPYGAVDTSETTAYEAIVAYCSAPDFEPVYHSTGKIINSAVGITEAKLPTQHEILVYPNPFNSSCAIVSYGPVEIYDVSGRLVDEITPEKSIFGAAVVRWTPPEGLASGIYYIKPVFGGQHARAVYLR